MGNHGITSREQYRHKVIGLTYTVGMARKYEILPGLPPYGGEEITTINDQPAFSEGYVVKFFRQDGSYWIANFKRGMSSFNGVYEYPNQILVFAGGEVYVMDPNQKEPLERFGYGYEVLETEDGSLACLDFGTALVIQPNGDKWEIRTHAFDGFSKMQYKDGKVEGVGWNIYDEKDSPFTLDLRAREFRFNQGEKEVILKPEDKAV